MQLNSMSQYTLSGLAEYKGNLDKHIFMNAKIMKKMFNTHDTESLIDSKKMFWS